MVAAGPASGPGANAATSSQGSAGPNASESEEHPDLLDGTLSGLGDLEADEKPKRGFLRLPTALDPWFAFKQGLRDKYGFSIGGSFGVLWQNYSSSPIGQFNAVG